jgi:hypothetical protein
MSAHQLVTWLETARNVVADSVDLPDPEVLLDLSMRPLIRLERNNLTRSTHHSWQNWEKRALLLPSLEGAPMPPEDLVGSLAVLLGSKDRTGDILSMRTERKSLPGGSLPTGECIAPEDLLARH